MGSLVAMLLVAPSADASLFDTYGLGPRGTAMGGSLVALSVNYDSVYYNPANLLSRHVRDLGFGLNLIAPAMTFNYLSGDEPTAPALPETNLGFHIGLSAPIGGLLNERVAVGAVLFHPLVQFTRIGSPDPALPQFYRYQDLPNKLIIATALAVEPIEWLRLGVGVQILAELEGEIHTALSLTEKRFTRETIDLELTGTTGLTAGVSVGPIYGLRFGAAFRAALQLDYALPIEVLLEEVGMLTVDLRGVSLYTPDQLAVGLAWESAPVDEPGWAVEVGLTWERWSAAPPSGAQFVIEVDDSVLRAAENAAGRPEQNIIEARAEGVPLGAVDTITPRVGVEWRPTHMWALRAGWFYRPTPLPRPTGDGNAMDAAAHVLSLGGGVTFSDPTRIHRTPMIVGLAVQLTLLAERLVPKAEGGTPAGVYQFSGVLWNVALDLQHAF